MNPKTTKSLPLMGVQLSPLVQATIITAQSQTFAPRQVKSHPLANPTILPLVIPSPTITLHHSLTYFFREVIHTCPVLSTVVLQPAFAVPTICLPLIRESTSMGLVICLIKLGSFALSSLGWPQETGSTRKENE